jgi:hypothetical protein
MESVMKRCLKSKEALCLPLCSQVAFAREREAKVAQSLNASFGSHAYCQVRFFRS